MQTFKKQNLNFLEILFTKYLIVNPTYVFLWYALVDKREDIAHYNTLASIKSMKGIAMEKYHAMEHHYPSRMDWINKYGYDPKQLHHLLRVEEYIERYINGESYKNCLISKKADYLKLVKSGLHSLENARWLANCAMDHIKAMCDKFIKSNEHKINQEIEELLDSIQYNIMSTAIKKEFGII